MQAIIIKIKNDSTNERSSKTVCFSSPSLITIRKYIFLIKKKFYNAI